MKIQLVLNSNTFAELSEHVGQKGKSVKEYIIESIEAWRTSKVAIPVEVKDQSKVHYQLDLTDEQMEVLQESLVFVEGMEQRPAKLLRAILLHRFKKTKANIDEIAIGMLNNDAPATATRGGRKRKGDGVRESRKKPTPDGSAKP